METNTATPSSTQPAPTPATNTGSTSDIQAAVAEQAASELKLGQFLPYDSQLSIKDIDGTRIVKCLYQISAKSGDKVRENVYVRVPTKHITEEIVATEIAKLAGYVVTYLQEQESLAIKADHKAGATQVFTNFLTLEKVIEALEVKEAGARLNKEKIGEWFSAELADNLEILFSDKIGEVDGAEEKVAAVLNAYKLKFESLAGGKTFIKEQDCEAMVQIIKASEAEQSFIGARFIARLEGMRNKEEEVLMTL